MATNPPRSRAKALSKKRISQIKVDITKALKLSIPTASSSEVSALTAPLNSTGPYDHRIKGKIYEASVLANLCDILHNKERLTLKLVNGSYLYLNQKGGDVDRTKDPWIEVWDTKNNLIGELWMNIEFLTISHDRRSSRAGFTRTNSDYHELDIALIEPHAGRGPYKPPHSEILLGIECKCTKVTKDIVRSVLGLRRELSVLNVPLTGFHFKSWTVNHSEPASVLLLYSSSDMRIYNSLHSVYDIFMVTHQL